MPKVYFECTYCGEQWEKTLWTAKEVEDEACFVCKDTSLKVRQESPKGDLYGYDSNDARTDAYIRKKQ